MNSDANALLSTSDLSQERDVIAFKHLGPRALVQLETHQTSYHIQMSTRSRLDTPTRCVCCKKYECAAVQKPYSCLLGKISKSPARQEHAQTSPRGLQSQLETLRDTALQRYDSLDTRLKGMHSKHWCHTHSII